MNAQEMIRSNVIIAAATDAAMKAPDVSNEIERLNMAERAAFDHNDTDRLVGHETQIFLSTFAAQHARRFAQANVDTIGAFLKNQVAAFSAPVADDEPINMTPRLAKRGKLIVANIKEFLATH